jgi:hypothetical protein
MEKLFTRLLTISHIRVCSLVTVALLSAGCGGSAEKTDAPVVVPTVQTATLTPAGGSIEMKDDQGATYRLTLPAGALGKSTAITISTLPVSPDQLFRIHLAPEGLLFQDGKEAALVVTLGAGMSLDARGGILYNGSPVPFVRGDGTLTINLSAFMRSGDRVAGLPFTRVLAALGELLISSAHAATQSCDDLPDDGGIPQRISPDGSLSAEQILASEFYVQCLQAAVANLEADGDFESALQANMTIAAFTQQFGLDAAGIAALEAASRNACAAYADVLASAEQAAVGTYGDLRTAMAKVMYWEAVTQSLGVECNIPIPTPKPMGVRLAPTQSPGANYLDLVERLSEQATTFYERDAPALTDSASSHYADAIREANDLDRLQDEAAALDLPANATAELSDVAEPALLDALFVAPWAACRDNGNYQPLMTLMDQLNSPSRVQKAAQYCGTSIGAEAFDAAAVLKERLVNPLGGTTQSAHRLTGTISAVVNGKLVISGLARAMSCPARFDSPEALVFSLEGTEVHRLTGANYLASNIELDVTQMLRAARQDPATIARVALTVKREGEACSGYWGSNPVPLVELTLDFSPIIAITAGGVHTCALTTAGSVKCWGGAMVGWGLLVPPPAGLSRFPQGGPTPVPPPPPAVPHVGGRPWVVSWGLGASPAGSARFPQDITTPASSPPPAMSNVGGTLI